MNQKINSISNSVLSLKVMPLKTELQFQPNFMQGVSKSIVIFASTNGEAMDLLQNPIESVRLLERNIFLSPQDRKRKNSVLEQFVTAQKLKNKI